MDLNLFPQLRACFSEIWLWVDVVGWVIIRNQSALYRSEIYVYIQMHLSAHMFAFQWWPDFSSQYGYEIYDDSAWVQTNQPRNLIHFISNNYTWDKYMHNGMHPSLIDLKTTTTKIPNTITTWNTHKRSSVYARTIKQYVEENPFLLSKWNEFSSEWEK